MSYIAKRIQDLQNYLPPLTKEPEAIDRFWQEQLSQHQSKPLNATLQRIETPLAGVDAYEATYQGFDETPIHGWYLVPSYHNQAQYPCLVMYQGYTVDRGLPERYAAWLMLGYAVYAVDTRGQGGDTGNALPEASGGTKGWITQNILDKEHSYYMAITIDSLKAVDWVLTRTEVNPHKIAVMGGSQGGGLSLIVSALHTGVSLTIADIPNMCHMDFGILNSSSSLSEAADYVKRYPDRLEAVLDTLSHFDIMNLTHKLHVPVRMSVGLKDLVCWPDTIFAAYNRIQTEKTIDIQYFAGHEISERQHRKHLLHLANWKSL